MKPKLLVVKPGDRDPPLNVVGVKITVLVPDAVSQSQQVTLQAGDEGAGPPPHSHPWEESFYITKGQVQFACGGQTTTCFAGTLIHVPAGTVHAFSFGPGGGEMLEVTGTGSKAVQMFSALDRELPPGPPEVSKVAQVGGRYGLAIHI
ncbi:cupin domain-containing protein [Pseudomonas sp.]|uniref:cupin domain-containing protein n=1 Tax=Pseudomonas sp. TaxID=306 RepID=UPI003BB5F9E4